jgi:hypothetical protein
VIGDLCKNVLRDKKFPQANEINCVLSADFGAPDGQTLDLEAGLAAGHRLTILAAGPYAGIERKSRPPGDRPLCTGRHGPPH